MLSSPPLSVTPPQSARSRWLGMVLLLVTLALWRRSEHSLAVDRIASRRGDH